MPDVDVLQMVVVPVGLGVGVMVWVVLVMSSLAILDAVPPVPVVDLLKEDVYVTDREDGILELELELELELDDIVSIESGLIFPQLTSQAFLHCFNAAISFAPAAIQF